MFSPRRRRERRVQVFFDSKGRIPPGGGHLMGNDRSYGIDKLIPIWLHCLRNDFFCRYDERKFCGKVSDF